MNITRQQTTAFRARRQWLTPSARGYTADDVLAILRALQPFPPIAGTMPGDAPHLYTRIEGYQRVWSEDWRARGYIVKGRFMRGNIAYVATEDLGLYAAAFRKPVDEQASSTVERILEMLRRYGPMRKSELRDLVEVERGRLNSALNKLQRSFDVVEDQREVEWDSPWGLLSQVHPQVDLAAWDVDEARAEAVHRLLRAFGPMTLDEMKAWSAWGKHRCRLLARRLEEAGRALRVRVDSINAYVAAEDMDELLAPAAVEPFAVILPSNDPLVLPQWPEVQKRYRSLRLPYCYGIVVVDGAVAGAAWGHYKRQYIWIEELSLEPVIVDDDDRVDAVLHELEQRLGGGHVPIHIYGINRDPESPWIRAILERNGYVWEEGYHVKRPP